MRRDLSKATGSRVSKIENHLGFKCNRARSRASGVQKNAAAMGVDHPRAARIAPDINQSPSPIRRVHKPEAPGPPTAKNHFGSRRGVVSIVMVNGGAGRRRIVSRRGRCVVQGCGRCISSRGLRVAVRPLGLSVGTQNVTARCTDRRTLSHPPTGPLEHPPEHSARARTRDRRLLRSRTSAEKGTPRKDDQQNSVTLQNPRIH
jgi:hypothetical protein